MMRQQAEANKPRDPDTPDIPCKIRLSLALGMAELPSRLFSTHENIGGPPLLEYDTSFLVEHVCVFTRIRLPAIVRAFRVRFIERRQPGLGTRTFWGGSQHLYQTP
jgi:hypothetical protein